MRFKQKSKIVQKLILLLLSLAVSCTQKKVRITAEDNISGRWIDRLPLYQAALYKVRITAEDNISGRWIDRLPLYQAALYGDITTLKAELEKLPPENINDPLGYWGQTLLHLAALYGQVEVLKYLLSISADIKAQTLPRADGGTPLHEVTRNTTDRVLGQPNTSYNIETLGRLFCEKFPNRSLSSPDTSKELLALAIQEDLVKDTSDVCGDKLEAAEVLLSSGAQVDAEDYRGNTPLHWAIYYNDLALVELFLQKDKEIANKANKCGRTPLHFAAVDGPLEIVEILLQNGAYIDAKDQDGKTPLGIAIAKENYRIVKAMLPPNQVKQKSIWRLGVIEEQLSPFDQVAQKVIQVLENPALSTVDQVVQEIIPVFVNSALPTLDQAAQKVTQVLRQELWKKDQVAQEIIQVFVNSVLSALDQRKIIPVLAQAALSPVDQAAQKVTQVLEQEVLSAADQAAQKVTQVLAQAALSPVDQAAQEIIQVLKQASLSAVGQAAQKVTQVLAQAALSPVDQVAQEIIQVLRQELLEQYQVGNQHPLLTRLMQAAKVDIALCNNVPITVKEKIVEEIIEAIVEKVMKSVKKFSLRNLLNTSVSEDKTAIALLVEKREQAKRSGHQELYEEIDAIIATLNRYCQTAVQASKQKQHAIVALLARCRQAMCKMGEGNR